MVAAEEVQADTNLIVGRTPCEEPDLKDLSCVTAQSAKELTKGGVPC
jgi:hypothetical protein